MAMLDRSPLYGKRVLITRPAHSAGPSAERFRELGAEPVVVPTVAIGAPDDPSAANAAVLQIDSYAWVVFTSRNGVDAFFETLERMGGTARPFEQTKIAAIGPKTCEALEELGVQVDFVPPRFIGEEVAAGLLTRTAPGERILLYVAQEAREVLPELLRAQGRIAEVVAAYKTRLTSEPDLPERAANCDIWTFTSASTVRGFLANVPDAPQHCEGKTIACIGPVTADAARSAGLRVDVVAEDFTIDSLLTALELRANAV